MSDTPKTEATVQQPEQAASVTVDSTTTPEQAQGEELIGGKFKDTDALLSAYKELEKKLGQGTSEADENTETSTEETDENTETSTEETDENTGDETGNEENPYGPVVAQALEQAEVNMDDARGEWEKDGNLSDETYDKFAKAGFPRPMVEAYLRGLQAASADAESNVEAQVAAVKQSVGGDEAFGKLQQHIQTQFSAADKQAYNDAVSSGDMAKVRKAVSDAHAQYLKDVGTEGDLTGGKTPTAKGYASEAEMLEDMKNPEYKTSQAFRDKVSAKIAASPGIVKTR